MRTVEVVFLVNHVSFCVCCFLVAPADTTPHHHQIQQHQIHGEEKTIHIRIPQTDEADMTKDSDGNSSGYSTHTSWKKHSTKEERRVFIMGNATVDASDPDTLINPYTAKRLLKNFRKRRKSNSSSPIRPTDYMLPLIDSSGCSP